MPLPEAYRSLLRPSSPDDAKASINCCIWFVQTLTILGVYFTHLHILTTLNFQRTKSLGSRYIILPPAAPYTYIADPAKMVGPGGLEPPTPRLSSACSNQLSYEPKRSWAGMGSWLKIGGAGEIRTRDPLLAKQVLCQLSYDPIRGRENGYIKNELRKIYFVRSTGTRKRNVSFDHRPCGLLRMDVSLERR